MARLKENINLSILDDIEHLAAGYEVLNAIVNLMFNIAAVYVLDQVFTYAIRMLACPC